MKAPLEKRTSILTLSTYVASVSTNYNELFNTHLTYTSIYPRKTIRYHQKQQNTTGCATRLLIKIMKAPLEKRTSILSARTSQVWARTAPINSIALQHFKRKLLSGSGSRCSRNRQITSVCCRQRACRVWTWTLLLKQQRVVKLWYLHYNYLVLY